MGRRMRYRNAVALLVLLGALAVVVISLAGLGAAVVLEWMW